MTLDARSKYILNRFVETNGYLAVRTITNSLNISRRTFYYDLKKINQFLQENGLQEIQRQKKRGYYLRQEDKHKIPSLVQLMNHTQYFFDKQDRHMMMAVQLLSSEKALFLEDMQKMTQVSKGTVSNDLKALKKALTKFLLEVKFDRKSGFSITGSETNKRSALVYYVTQLVTTNKRENILEKVNTAVVPHLLKLPYFSEQRLYHIKNVIVSNEEMLGVELTDDTIEYLAFQFMILMQRIRDGHRVLVERFEKEALQQTKEFSAARAIINQLSKLENDPLPEDEVYFVTMNLLGSKVNHSDFEVHKTEEMKSLKAAIHHMVLDFQKYACVVFQNKEKLETTLFLHLKPAYYRLKYNVDITDEWSSIIQQKYPEIYQLTSRVVFHLEAILDKKIPEQELAYIAIHFGGWLKKEGKKPAPRRRALIVCQNGIGTSNMLRMQLEELLSTIDIAGCISLRQYYQMKIDVEVIFSTTPIKTGSVPVILVEPIMNEKEKELLLKQYNFLFGRNSSAKSKISVESIIDIVQHHAQILDKKELVRELSCHLQAETTDTLKERDKPMLNELLTEEMIQLVDEVEGWEKAIKLASRPLLDRNFIEQAYIDSMIDDIKTLGPYVVIAPRIAIPHSRPENGVNKVGISLLKSSESISFSDQEKHQANLIFVLAAIDNETHLKALSQLTNLLGEEENINRLIETSNKQEILELVDYYSQE
ncbi:PRD domain-containing protein [Sediminibacillus dalangtanensis]|uniref:PRD domain-containing protein n=1 Tax=Sediminibacillus dalangtanensis TaxID=2729421 RepID=A0ABX7VUY6_9BACI|nr:BglG family transcription antiterminator [Sediminibacillus dalangtanensis]QTN00502.1 PRD domain-containing protein [Sediminibacillus dalangtanensis]